MVDEKNTDAENEVVNGELVAQEEEQSLAVPKKGSVSEKGDVAIGAGGELVQLKVGNAVLDVPNFNPNALAASVAPEKEAHISMELAKIVVPVMCLDIFNVPKRLLVQLEVESQKSETLASMDVVDLTCRIEAFTMRTGHMSYSRVSGGSNPIERFSFDAVENRGKIIGEYLDNVVSLCDAVISVKKQHASTSAFHFEEVMGDGSGVDESLIAQILLSPVDDFVMNMNQMSAGTKGWKILSLIQNAKEVAGFIANRDIMEAYGCSKPVSVLNKLDCRISPNQQLLFTHLCQLMQVVQRISAEKNAEKKMSKLLMELCEKVKDSIENLKLRRK
ncbi:hypothetical protein ACFL2R_02385 [Patescibacteria group bacterium]